MDTNTDKEITNLIEDLKIKGQGFESDIDSSLTKLDNDIDQEEEEMKKTEDELVGIVKQGITDLEKIEDEFVGSEEKE